VFFAKLYDVKRAVHKLYKLAYNDNNINVTKKLLLCPCRVTLGGRAWMGWMGCPESLGGPDARARSAWTLRVFQESRVNTGTRDFLGCQDWRENKVLWPRVEHCGTVGEILDPQTREPGF